jgi:hypothetical protein
MVPEDYVGAQGEILLNHYPPIPGEIPAYDSAISAQVIAQANGKIIQQMNALDGGGQARSVRELTLLNAPSTISQGYLQLQQIEIQIANLGNQLNPPRSSVAQVASASTASVAMSASLK